MLYPAVSNEITTGWLDVYNYLTSITTGILKDIGFEIDESSTYIKNTGSYLNLTSQLGPIIISGTENADNPETIASVPVGGINNFVGNQADNIIYGYSGNDTIFGYHGNDIIFGGGDNDMIYAGYGNDVIFGGTGHDVIHTIDGSQDIIYGDQNDFVYADKYDIVYNVPAKNVTTL